MRRRELLLAVEAARRRHRQPRESGERQEMTIGVVEMQKKSENGVEGCVETTNQSFDKCGWDEARVAREIALWEKLRFWVQIGL